MPQHTRERRSIEERLGAMLSSTPGRLDRFAELAAGVTDWEALYRIALEHGVDGVLFHYLATTRTSVPPDVAARAERQAAFRALWQGHVRTVLATALEALADRALSAVALKGPILAERLYPDPTLRPSIDVDLLVADGDLERTIEALGEVGFAYEADAVNRYHRVHHHHVGLVHESGLLVELHFRAHSGFGTLVASEPLIERSRSYRASDGTDVRVLAPEDELLFLVVHAVRHYDADLVWLYDVKLLLDRYPEIDCDTVAERARGWALGRACAVGLADLERELGTRAPAGAPRLSRGRAALVAWLRRIRRGAHYEAARVRLAGLVYSAALCDSLGRSASSLGRNTLRIAGRRASSLAGPPLGPGAERGA